MKNTRLLKCLGFAVAILLTLFLVYQAVLAFPQPLFPYRATYKQIAIYSRSELPKNIDDILQKTDSLLSRSELYNPQTKSKVFVCDSYRLFWFYTGGLRRICAVTFAHTTRYTFFPKVDYDRDLVLFERNGPTDKRERHFTNTLAHEITHLYIFDYLGRKSELALPDWIKEGYCEVIGQANAISPDEGMRRLRNGDGNIPGFFYFRSRRMMENLLNAQGLSAKEVLSHPPDEKKVLEALMQSLNSNPSDPKASASFISPTYLQK